MKTNLKRGLASLLVLCMVLAMLPVAALADGEGESTDEAKRVEAGAEVNFPTLKAALYAAKDGDTIVMLKDVEVVETVSLNGSDYSIGKGVTLDGAGHTISNNAPGQQSSPYLLKVADEGAKIKNLTIDGAGRVDIGIIVPSDAEVTLSEVNIKNCNNQSIWMDGSTVTADKLTTSGGKTGINGVSGGNKLTLTNSTIGQAITAQMSGDDNVVNIDSDIYAAKLFGSLLTYYVSDVEDFLTVAKYIVSKDGQYTIYNNIEDVNAAVADGGVRHTFAVDSALAIDAATGEYVDEPRIGQTLAIEAKTSGGSVLNSAESSRVSCEWYYFGTDKVILENGSKCTIPKEAAGQTIYAQVSIENYDGSAIWTSLYVVPDPEVTGVSVVDGTDGYTPVTIPEVGQKLLANIETNKETIGGYPVNPDASYEWYYLEGSEDTRTPLGTEPYFTVTSDSLGKTICVEVGYGGGKVTWTAEGIVALPTVTDVSVVDGTDGVTPVTIPGAGQILLANIETNKGTIGGYPVNKDASYEWYYLEGSEDTRTPLGTGAYYTVTDDSLGKTICVEVSVEGYEGGKVTWTAEGVVVTPEVTGVSVVDGTDGYTPVTIPEIGQKLLANIETNTGTIGGYPVNTNAIYVWYYQNSSEGSKISLGNDPYYTVTEDDDGRTICVDVFVEGYVGFATWEADHEVGYERPSGGRTSYSISVEKTNNGTVTSSRKSSSSGITITITTKPDEGYELYDLTVTDKNDKELKLKDKGNGKYTFTMPSSKVEIEAKFTAIGDLPFNDVDEDDWYYDAVYYVYNNDLMQGTGGKTFAPTTKLSRDMMAQLLYNMEGKPSTSGSPFDDVDDDAWYADAVNWAAKKGLVEGYGNDKFGPSDKITREQMAAILYRYADMLGYDVSSRANLSKFDDADEVSDWATTYVRWAVGAGLISGKGNDILDPTGTATRAEVATIIMNFCQEIEKD